MLTNRLRKKMGDRRVQRRFWPTHIYDYNYKVSEGYYKPQYNYMGRSDFERARYSPPKHASYAERFATSPWYGTARGLPYGNRSSALNEPLLKPSERHFNESPLVRDIRHEAEEDIPLNVRTSRRRRKFEEEDRELGILPPRPPRTLSFEDVSKNRPPRYKDVGEKLRALDAELIRLAPRRSSGTTENYTTPSGTSVHKSSRVEVSHSSRPPVGPRARKLSFNEEYADLQPRPRQRISSVGESTDFLRSSRQSSVTEDDDLPGRYTSRADKLRDMRRFKQSRDITEGVHELVEKMRSARLDREAGYMDRQERGLRPSKLDPHLLEDNKVKSKFTYYNVGSRH